MTNISKAFRKCVELVEEMLEKGYRLQISSTEVERLIKIGLGADKRTVQKYMRMLTEDLGFLKVSAKNPLARAPIFSTRKFPTKLGTSSFGSLL